jgi:hypothetical protein
MSNVGVGLLVLGVLLLTLGAFGLIPASPDERQRERDTWLIREPMDQADRLFRQRAFLLRVSARYLIAFGIISLGTGALLIAAG